MDISKEYISMCDCDEIQHTLDEPLGPKEFGHNYYDRNGDIWLPRQDQIQEMMYTLACQGEDSVAGKTSVGCPDCIVEDLHEFSKDDCKHDLNSMEQLWLAFYMEEKHSKTWNGKEWKDNN